MNDHLIRLLTHDPDGDSGPREPMTFDEQWLRLTYEETEAVRRWFAGDTHGALHALLGLAVRFEALRRLGQPGRPTQRRLPESGCRPLGRGRAYFAAAYEESSALDYKVGAALGTEGLRRLGKTTHPGDADFSQTHLERLYRRLPSPFVPCYVLLIP